MTRSHLLVAALASGLAVGLAADRHASAETFHLFMTGSQEIPPADPDGYGIGTVTIDPMTNAVSWNITYANIAAPTLMHIHTGAWNVNGGVLVNMGVVTMGGPGTLINSTVTTAANVANILANPAGFYVNIHNAPFPGGVIRSQLLKENQVFPIELAGACEVPGPGDPDGFASGTVYIDPPSGSVGWNLTYADIAAPTAMHIHVGSAGVAGPVVVGMGVATLGGAGTLINRTAGVAVATLNDILADPVGYYVNIHNADFPAGAVRGQLVEPPPPACPADFDGDGEVDGADLGALLGAWGSSDPKYNLSGSGEVGGADLGILLGDWGPCPVGGC